MPLKDSIAEKIHLDVDQGVCLILDKEFLHFSDFFNSFPLAKQTFSVQHFYNCIHLLTTLMTNTLLAAVTSGFEVSISAKHPYLPESVSSNALMLISILPVA